ncbi:hypothetical protein Tco_1001314 [Tanacetum coccineum]
MHLGTSVSLLKSAISSTARLATALDELEDAIDEDAKEITWAKGWVVIKSFLCYMRPLIIIDAAHLKRPYLGTNLVAVGMDGNNQIIHIATSVSQGEIDVSTWHTPDDIQLVLPHVMDKKQPGRPKKKDHIRSQREGPIITKCERCGAKGYNRTACNVPLPKIQNMIRKKLKSTQQESSTPRNIFRNGSHEEANHDIY